MQGVIDEDGHSKPSKDTAWYECVPKSDKSDEKAA